MRLILKVVGLEQEIFTKIKHHAEYGLAVKVALFVAAIFGLAGAIGFSVQVLFFSAGLGVATSVAGLVGEGLNF